VELPVWTKWLKAQRYSIIEGVAKWLYFLTKAKGMDENRLLATLEDPEFKEAMEVIKGYTTEQKRRHAYDMRENYQRIIASLKADGFDEGKSEGKIEGKIEGKTERNLEIARTIKAKGYSVEQIADITGLDSSQMQSISANEA
jgi:predicted transposase/invertase (TIGR01784 family)